MGIRMSGEVALPAPASQFSVKDFVGGLGRRRGLVAAIAAVCVISALAIALLLPPEYRSMGTILIEQQEVPADLVRSTVTAYADQRLQVIAQRVMTSSNLLDIIHRYSLYPERQGK